MTKRKLRRKDLCERFGGITPRTVERWQADPKMDFPPPIYLGRFPLWDEDQIEQWERRRAVRTAAA